MALVILLLIAGFGLGLPEPIPAPAAAEPTIPPTSDGDVLDWTGIGAVRVGMPLTELLLSLPDRNALVEINRDEERGCVQYQYSRSISDYAPWVWVRDGTVVTVGVQFGQGVPTVFGPELGGPFDPDDPALSGWWRDEAAPLPVLRYNRGDLIATLADDRATGNLTYASVGTAAGDECEPAPPVPFDLADLPDVSAIEGDSVSGVSLGMTVDEVAAVPGWTRDPTSESEGCVSFFDEQGAGAAVSPVDGAVWLSSWRLAGGPAFGQRVAEATSALVVQRTSRDVNGLTVVDATSADGRPLQLFASTHEIAVAGLDLPAVPTDVPLADKVVEFVAIGRSCRDLG